ncbi:MAG: trigger factor [Patescibacteria group bacterium]
MEVSSNKQAGGSLVLKFVLADLEYEKIKAQATINLSNSHNIAGFRSGKAPVDIVKKHLGEAVVLDEELMLAVKKYYLPYLQNEDIEVVGRPEIKLLTQQPFFFEVVSSLLPEVKLGAWEKIKISHPNISVTDNQVADLLQQLRESRASEALSDKLITKGDRVVLDFQVSVDNVAIESGQTKDYSAIVGKNQLLPGFEENLLGLKSGDSKNFELKFPSDYHKNLAGRNGLVKVKIKAVYNRIIPETNDDFAKAVGKFSSLTDLREKLKHNLLHEAEHEEEIKTERNMFDQLLAVAKFSDIPEVLIINEVEQMINEFSQSISTQGVSFDDYLKSINKTVDGLKQEFKEPAAKRVKVALIIRDLGKINNLTVNDDEVEEEVAKTLAYYSQNEEVRSKVDTAEYREQIKNVLINQKVVNWLKEKIVVNK